MVDILRPKFRKDEETAWTILRTAHHRTSKIWPETLAPSRRASVISLPDVANPCYPSTNFSFENLLFEGPVYRRLLIAKLTETPTALLRSVSAPEVTPLNQQSQALEEAPALSTMAEDLALQLRQEDAFSSSCVTDYTAFCARPRPRAMPRRHLPLCSILHQQEATQEEQHGLNISFFEAVKSFDLEKVATALDKGADINFRQSGKSALDYCVDQWMNSATPKFENWPPTTVAEFLLLYEETLVPYRFESGCTILHLFMHVGASAGSMQPFLSIGNAYVSLGEQDRHGCTPLHHAARCPVTGAYSIVQLSTALGSAVLNISRFKDGNGRDPLESIRAGGAWSTSVLKQNAAALCHLTGGSPNEAVASHFDLIQQRQAVLEDKACEASFGFDFTDFYGAHRQDAEDEIHRNV